MSQAAINYNMFSLYTCTGCIKKKSQNVPQKTSKLLNVITIFEFTQEKYADTGACRQHVKNVTNLQGVSKNDTFINKL